MGAPAKTGRTERTRPLIYRVLERIAGDDRLSGMDRLVLIYLTKYANSDGSSCTVSNQTLADALYVHVSTVKRSITRLRKFGYIERHRRRWDSARTTVRLDQEGASVRLQEDREGSRLRSRRRTTALQTAHECARTDPITDPITDQEECDDKRPDRSPLSDTQGHFNPPTPMDVTAYAIEIGAEIDAERFVDYYASKGWKVGSSPMRDWKAVVRNWIRRDREGKPRAARRGVDSDRLIKHQGCRASDDSEWMYQTYRVTDHDQFGGGNGQPAHELWEDYLDHAASLPPRTVIPFELWRSERQEGGPQVTSGQGDRER